MESWAKKPNIREKSSFLAENIEPIKSCGQLNFIRGKSSLIKSSSLGFDVLIFDGHTERQMLPVIKYKGKTIVFAAVRTNILLLINFDLITVFPDPKLIIGPQKHYLFIKIKNCPNKWVK